MYLNIAKPLNRVRSLLPICIPQSFIVSVAGNLFPPMLRGRHLSSLRPRNIIWIFQDLLSFHLMRTSLIGDLGHFPI